MGHAVSGKGDKKKFRYEDVNKFDVQVGQPMIQMIGVDRRCSTEGDLYMYSGKTYCVECFIQENPQMAKALWKKVNRAAMMVRMKNVVDKLNY